MGLFEATDLIIRTQILEANEPAAILEISFSGIHHHHWPDYETGRRVQAFMESEIRALRPAACLFDFLGYDYTFGNEIGEPIFSTLYYCGPPRPPFAIVAAGRTGRSLRGLFAFGNLDKINDIGFFETIESGRAFLRRALENRVKAPPAER
jgi:hypothetical protein